MCVGSDQVKWRGPGSTGCVRTMGRCAAGERLDLLSRKNDRAGEDATFDWSGAGTCSACNSAHLDAGCSASPPAVGATQLIPLTPLGAFALLDRDMRGRTGPDRFRISQHDGELSNDLERRHSIGTDGKYLEAGGGRHRRALPLLLDDHRAALSSFAPVVIYTVARGDLVSSIDATWHSPSRCFPTPNRLEAYAFSLAEHAQIRRANFHSQIKNCASNCSTCS